MNYPELTEHAERLIAQEMEAARHATLALATAFFRHEAHGMLRLWDELSYRFQERRPEDRARLQALIDAVPDEPGSCA